MTYKANFCDLIGLFTVFLFTISLYLCAWNEYDKTKGYVGLKCRVDAISIKSQTRGYRCTWDVTVVDNVDRNATIMDIFTERSEYLARQKAKEQYAPNRVYPCYGLISKSKEKLLWSKPSNNAALIVFFIATIFLILFFFGLLSVMLRKEPPTTNWHERYLFVIDRSSNKDDESDVEMLLSD
ncbi:unnamed protein product [Adineta ricciae]|uniref:Uncharacterized protein n=1 Tax=Adineta ricciae TaxID=249248 RepID=A0A815WAU7_ADIRI|nr:unnamed protein product [Adineta ricciae]CAF1540862.1 unnamed protein product [Adineta ricciae]